MAERPPGFTRYESEPAADLPVKRWEPGLSAAPESWYGPYLDEALLAVAFGVAKPEDIRTGLLAAEWNGHPASSRVVATSSGRLPTEPFAGSDRAAKSE